MDKNVERKMEILKELYADPEFKKQLGGHKIAWISLVGSQMYGIEDKKSDYDFKVFIIPNFNDLYYNIEPSFALKYKGNDIDVKDVRKFRELIQKGSTPYIEALFSPYKVGQDSYLKVLSSKSNPPVIDIQKYFHSIKGMQYQKVEAIKKDYPSQETNEGYKRKKMYGYDTKQLLHVYRLHYILQNVYSLLFKTKKEGKEWTYKIYVPTTSQKKKLMDAKYHVDGFTKEQAIKHAKSVIENDSYKYVDLIDEAVKKGFDPIYNSKSKFFEILDNLNQHSTKEAVKAD